MADPLTAVAQDVAPAQTNIFEPSTAENVFARYSFNRRAAEETEQTANRAERLFALRRSREQDQWNRDREATNSLLRSRQETEALQKSEADAMRGDFLRDLAQNLDTNDPEYHKKAGLMFADLPPALQQDEAIKSVMASMGRQADANRTQRNRLAAEAQKQEGRLEKIMVEGKNISRFLTADDMKNAPRNPVTGEIDMEAMTALAQRRSEEADLGQFEAKENIKQRGRVELFDLRKMDPDQKERARETRDFVIQDKIAFPSAQDNLVKKIMRERDTTERAAENLAKKDPRMRRAKDWDQKKFENEVNAARRYDTPEEYIELVPNLGEFEKDNRRRVWEYANQNADLDRAQGGTQNAPQFRGQPESSYIEVEHEGVRYRKFPGDKRWTPVQ